MREPSPIAFLFAWHRAALAGRNPPDHEGLPECGWFKTRLVKGGPWVPAKIWIRREIDADTGELTAPEEYLCEVDGRRRDAALAWGSLCKNPISREEYDALIDRAKSLPVMQATMAKIDLTQHPVRP